MNLRSTLTINKNGHLELGGCDAEDLAKEFGTPLYVMERGRIESAALEMKSTLDKKYPDNLVCFASKAFGCKAIYQIIAPLGLGADVASGGELYTALAAGFDPQRLYLHGNNKSRAELAAGANAGVHAIVIDHFDEIKTLAEVARGQGSGVRGQGSADSEEITNYKLQITNTDGDNNELVGGDPLGAPQKTTDACIGGVPNGLPPTGNSAAIPSEIRHSSLVIRHSPRRQGVLIRINPEVDAHTHHFIQTARADSKFGFLPEDVIPAVKEILSHPCLDFLGIHCHIGSQIFEIEPFLAAVDRMTDLIAVIRKEIGGDVRELNMGGGYAIRYLPGDEPPPLSEFVGAIADKLNACIAQKSIGAPKLIIEPGRSLVGEAGTTLYTVGAVKKIPGLKNYVAVDGGLFENPRYTLYDAKYDAIVANKALESATENFTVAGKCCETDTLIEKVALPASVASGDILAVLSTGAYNFSMASNYNRNPVPPVVLCGHGKAQVIVRPQGYADVAARDEDLTNSE
ncbi:MAG: diaminopimelate decarboxylase [Firmicutes bacterium]|nr:diaminopimelate decarboxylase [Bacillota bacterium]